MGICNLQEARPRDAVEFVGLAGEAAGGYLRAMLKVDYQFSVLFLRGVVHHLIGVGSRTASDGYLGRVDEQSALWLKANHRVEGVLIGMYVAIVAIGIEAAHLNEDGIACNGVGVAVVGAGIRNSVSLTIVCKVECCC